MPASRSLIALLVGTVVFFALWMVALKPSSKSSGSGRSSQGLGAYQSAINKAHRAVATSNANDAASGNENAAGSSSKAATSQTTHTSRSTTKSVTKPSAKSSPTAANGQSSVAQELSTVKAAVTDHKVLALLFYNPAAADDQAVKQELASVPTHKGQVVKLAIPLNQSGSFTAVTQQVPVNLSPTLVVVSRGGNADEIVGYTAPFVIDQQVDVALASS